MSLSPAQREQRRLAALERWAKQDPAPFMKSVRAGLVSKWERNVLEEAEGPLSEHEIERRIEAKRRAHYSRLTLASLKARAEKKVSA